MQYLFALGETVTEGTINVTLNWSVKPGQTFPVVKDTLDLCDQMVELHDPCPLSIGNHKEHYSGYFPQVYPKASQITMNIIFNVMLVHWRLCSKLLAFHQCSLYKCTYFFN